MSWTEVSFSDVFRFRNGKSIKPGSDGEHPAYGSNGKIGQSPGWMYENAIILGRVGAYCGSVELCRERFWASDNTIVVEPLPDRMDVDFSYYYLVYANLNRHAGGAAQPLLTQGTLKGLVGKFPNLETQRRIAEVLSAYDGLIENNTRRITILEDMARRLFEEWFVKPIGKLPLPGARLEEWLLPDGWQFLPLGSAATVTMGQSPPSTEYTTDREGLPFHQGVTEFEGYFHATKLFCRGPERYRRADAGDILFSVRAPVGRIAMALGPMVLGRGLSAIRATVTDQSYLLIHLRSQFSTTDLFGGGTIFKSITKNDLLSVPILVPSEEERKRFEIVAENSWSLIRSLHLANSNLHITRDLLLPKLISGEIEVRAAEDALEAAAA